MMANGHISTQLVEKLLGYPVDDLSNEEIQKRLEEFVDREGGPRNGRERRTRR